MTFMHEIDDENLRHLDEAASFVGAIDTDQETNSKVLDQLSEL